jgi:hypothetical protein
MLWRYKILRISAALGVAFGAAHTAERLKAPAAEQSVLVAAVRLASDADPKVAGPEDSAVPQSASLSDPGKPGMADLVGITPVAATLPVAGGDRCRPSLQLTALPGAMVHLSLSAPCNRNERVIIRHAGLSFAVRTQVDGNLTSVVPALKTDVMVAVYLQDSRLVLGKVAVPEAAGYSRLALIWEPPAELELRVTDGYKVLVGNSTPMPGEEQRVIALGQQSVQSPVLARVYSVPGVDLGEVDITGELRITPASCGRTLRLDTVYSSGGVATRSERAIPVPLCGTAGDILLLKNLGTPLKLAAPR